MTFDHLHFAAQLKEARRAALAIQEATEARLKAEHAQEPTMIGHGYPPDPFEEAYLRAATALIERTLKAEARVAELEALLRERRP